MPNRKSYLLWLRNHRTQIIHYRCEVFRSLTSPCSRHFRSPCSAYSSKVQLETFVLFFVSELPQETQLFFCSHTVFSLNLLFLCLSKYDRILKFLLHDSHGIRTLETTHRGTDLQSLHASSHLCHVRTASLATAFKTLCLCHRTCNICNHMVMTCDFIIKKVNSLFRLDLTNKCLHN